MRYPLIDFHGNQGSINGDGPAAMRYTEGRLNKLSEEGMLSGIKKDCVDFIPNYSDDAEEPITLPSIFPNLLCNPNSGIGVAMACSWACHNLKEVETAILSYLAGEEPMLPGPDFPTGGIIINKNDIPNIMRTGQGSVKIRAKYIVKKNQITITEIPYGTNVEGLLNEIDKYCSENEKSGISDVADHTNNKGICIDIVCEKTANPETVMKKLFAKTNLQTSFSYNQVALINKVPTELNLKDCCKVYVEHNLECIKRETQFDLNKAKSRLHIVKGLLIALENIDNIIQLIKQSESVSVACDNLIKKYKLDNKQAKAILDMKLSRLAKLEKVELETEEKELVDTTRDLENILNSIDRQKEILKSRLANIVKKYGDDRRTELIQIETTKEDKEIADVEPEKCVVVMTESGLIKRIPTSSFRTQKRNGKGIKTQDDVTSYTIRTNTIDSLMIFSNQGKMYRILVNDIPVGTNVSKGTSITNLVQMDLNEKPNIIYSLYRDTDAKFVLFTTKKGLVKKTALEEYTKTRKKTGMAAINLRENDSIASVNLIKDEDIVLITKKGMAIRIKSTDIGAMGRMTGGVKGINLNEGDYVIATLPIRETTDQMAIIAENGLGKKFNLSELLIQNRGGKGLICYKGSVAGAALIEDTDLILIVGDKNSVCISAEEIPLMSRIALGNQLIKTNKVKSVTKV